MDMEALELEVEALRGCYGSLATDQERLKELNAYLERRVRALEQRLSEEAPPPLAGAAVDLGAVKAEPAAVHPEGRDDGKVEPPNTEGGAGKAEATEDDLLVEYGLGESIWDGAIFVGLPELTPGGSCILFVSMLLNAAVQVYICVVLFMSEDFMKMGQYDEIKRPMLDFRLNTGHDYAQVDSRRRSLMGRVCEDDQSLSLGFRQADILAEINAYLGMEPSELVRLHFGTGPLLCGVCILLFAATVVQELRSTVESTYAVCALPTGPRTLLEDGRIVAIHRGRFVCVMANNVVRTGVAVMLLVTGFTWLAGTSSITDLILNAAALSFVMDMDECLFQTTVPVAVHKFVNGLEALRYRRSRWNSEAIVPILAIAAIVVAVFPILVNPNAEDMIKVKQLLCGGNTNFVVQRNEVGFVAATSTTPFSEDAPPGLIERAVDELTYSELGAVTMQFSLFSQNQASFWEYATKTLAAWTGTAECIDQDVAFGGYLLDSFPQIFTALRYITGRHAGLSLIDRPFACSEYRDLCQSWPIVRSTCPVTCGCGDPFSGLLRATHTQGCAGMCRAARTERLRNAPCSDVTAAANTSAWRSYWSKFLEIFVEGEKDLARRNLIEAVFSRKRDEGCSNDELLPVANVTDCDDQSSVMQHYGLSALTSTMCPSRCCRGPNLPAECPAACSAAPPAGGPTR